jgi:hypothetical protein
MNGYKMVSNKEGRHKPASRKKKARKNYIKLMTSTFAVILIYDCQELASRIIFYAPGYLKSSMQFEASTQSSLR